MSCLQKLYILAYHARSIMENNNNNNNNTEFPGVSRVDRKKKNAGAGAKRDF